MKQYEGLSRGIIASLLATCDSCYLNFMVDELKVDSEDRAKALSGKSDSEGKPICIEYFGLERAHKNVMEKMDQINSVSPRQYHVGVFEGGGITYNNKSTGLHVFFTEDFIEFRSFVAKKDMEHLYEIVAHGRSKS